MYGSNDKCFSLYLREKSYLTNYTTIPYNLPYVIIIICQEKYILTEHTISHGRKHII